jgi:hypothetical protein
LDSGDTSGNVIDNPVPEDTETGTTTPDLPAGEVTAPGATPVRGNDETEIEPVEPPEDPIDPPDPVEPPEDITDDVVDEPVTNQDDGGTNGDTEIAPPPD